MRTLNTYVHAVHTDEQGNQQSGTFGPGDVLPDWARKSITNPDVWDGEDADIPAPVEPSPVLERPKGNASRETWAAYAAQEDVEIEADMNRDDIIAAVDLSKE